MDVTSADWAKVIMALELATSLIIGIGSIIARFNDGDDNSVTPIIASWFGLVVFLLMLVVYNLGVSAGMSG